MVHSEKGRHLRMQSRSWWGVSLCISGQITYTMNGKEFISTPDTAILLPKGATYSLHGDSDGFFPVINFECTGLSCDEIMVIPLRNASPCINLFKLLQGAFASGKSHFYRFSLLYQLFDEITSQSAVKHPLLSSALNYIEQNLSVPSISNKSLADFLGISEVYLRKLFRDHMGMTPKQYIIKLRLQKAKQLLTDTKQTITEISEACGFTSVYHFSREFKQKTDISPTQYAEANRIFKI